MIIYDGPDGFLLSFRGDIDFLQISVHNSTWSGQEIIIFLIPTSLNFSTCPLRGGSRR